MKKINDDNLKKALHLYAEKAANSFPDEETVSHINFSDEFEQKMNDIIKKRKKPIYIIFNTTAKKVASIAAAFVLIISLAFSVDAVRERFAQMLQKSFSNHIEIEIEGDKTEYIAEIYAITEIPEGYTMSDEMISISMVNRDYEKADGSSFSFTQISTANDPMVYIDNEHSNHYTKTIDGYELYISDFKNENMKIIYWTEDGYLFHLTFYSRPTDDEVIHIIKSNTVVGYQEEE